MRAEPKSPIFEITSAFAWKTNFVTIVLTLQIGYLGNSVGSGLVMKTNVMSVDCSDASCILLTIIWFDIPTIQISRSLPAVPDSSLTGGPRNDLCNVSMVCFPCDGER
jgi:hypothetical protein